MNRYLVELLRNFLDRDILRSIFFDSKGAKNVHLGQDLARSDRGNNLKIPFIGREPMGRMFVFFSRAVVCMGACKVGFKLAERWYPEISISRRKMRRGWKRFERRQSERDKDKEKSAGVRTLQPTPDRLMYVIDLLCDALALRAPR